MLKILSLVSLSAFYLSGCATSSATVRAATAKPIHHIVFINLSDPTQSEELIRDSRALAEIPGVSGLIVGPRYNSGRAAAATDFDVGLSLDLASDADYRRYLDHPLHQALITKWRPRWQSAQIRDFSDPGHE